MSDPNDKSENAAETPEAELLQPERNGPSAARPRKEPPVIEGKADEAGRDAGKEAAAPNAGASSGRTIGVYGTALAAGLLGAAILGGGLYGAGFLDQGASDRAAINALDARIGTVETNDAARASALTSVEEKLQTASASAENAANLAARLETLETGVNDLKTALADAQSAMAAGTARIDELAKAMPPADIVDQIGRLESLVKVLNTAVDTLAPRITALDTRVAALEAKKDDPDAAARAALGLALSNLTRAATRAEPFARELDVVAEFLPNEPELAELKTVAADGVPTATSLEAQFPQVVREVLDAERAAKNDSLWQRFLSNARKLVTLRRVGEVAGEDTDAVLARMEERVKRGDLSATLAEAKGLQGTAAEAASPWVKDVTARVTTDDLLAALTANVTKRLAVGRSAAGARD
jgi:hypothetical protein